MTVTSTSAAITKFRPAQERNYHLEDARKVANYIKAKTTHEPEVAVVLSSRLTQGFALVLEEADRIPYEEIQQEVLPNFPTCSVAPAKDGAFIFGSVDGVSVLVMFGRFHTYEGHSSQATAFPMRVMKELGIQTVILTNASRGLSPTLEIGDVMLIVDHYNTERGADSHPLAGVNIDAHGPRFLRCDNLYDPHLRRLLRKIAKQKGIQLKQGGYIFISGPSYDTPMEEDGLRRLCEKRGGWGRALMYLKHLTGSGSSNSGAKEWYIIRVLDRLLNRCGLHDTAVGMSTVPEVLVADHCGLRVLALTGIYFVCKENTRRFMGGNGRGTNQGPNGNGIAHYEYDDHKNKRAQYEKKRRAEEGYRQEQIAPKMIALLRGMIQTLGDRQRDIDMEFDVQDITRWRFPTKLCVSWTRLFVGTALTAFTLTVGASTLLTYAAERRRRY